MRDQRGATLIEVMIAMTIVLIVLVGFIATLNAAARSTATGHRHTVTAYLRGALLDRLSVTPRPAVRRLPANTWIVDTCYDVDSQPIPGFTNDALDPAFACPAKDPVTFYRSWVRLEPVGPDPAVATSWTVRTFGERVPADCLDPKTQQPPRRSDSPVCVAGELLLTD